MRTLYLKGFVGGPSGFIARTRRSGGGSVDTLLSIAVTFTASAVVVGDTFTPQASGDRCQAVATGTYSISGMLDITTLVTWTSGTGATATISNGGGTQGQITAVSANNGTTGAATTSLITATLGAVSGNRTVSVDCDRDATSSKRVPSNAYQWATLIGVTAPASLWLCQEASGNLADTIGGFTLTANASPSYQQSVTGWTRKAVTLTGVSTQRFLNNASGDNATNSALVLLYVGFTGTPTASTYISSCGGSDDFSITAGSGAPIERFRYREGANIVQTVSTYANPTVYPVVGKHDITTAGGTARLYTDSEKLSPTYGVTAGTSFALGAIGGTSATCAILYAARWFGASAEQADATIKAMEVALGWTISWS